MYEEIRKQAENVANEICDAGKLKKGQILVVGCSSSEVCGDKIGTNSNLQVAEAVFEGIYKVTQETGIYLAAQCCEHLNRAIIVEREAVPNTYGSVEYLRKIFTEAINHPDIVALSIGTRPDCLPDEVIALLNELNSIKPVWIELGLQTIHEKTAEFINRGYNLDCFNNAVTRLNQANIDIIVHLILGLPGESMEDILQSVDYVCSLHIQGIKLQLLHILKNTTLADIYMRNPFHVFTMDEYVSLIGKCLEHIPSNIVIHRLTGDGPKSLLIEPLWSGNKKLVLNTLNKYLSDMDIIQGSKVIN